MIMISARSNARWTSLELEYIAECRAPVACDDRESCPVLDLLNRASFCLRYRHGPFFQVISEMTRLQVARTSGPRK